MHVVGNTIDESNPFFSLSPIEITNLLSNHKCTYLVLLHWSSSFSRWRCSSNT